VRWLEDFRDDTEHRVREALDVATARNDDLALRRVWSRLADLMPRPRARLRWSFLLGATTLLGGVVAGAVLLRPLLQEGIQRWPSVLSATSGRMPLRTPAPAITAPAPTPPPPQPEVVAIDDPTPVLLGPAVVRTGAREGRAVRLKSGARVDLRSQTTLVVDAGQRPVLRRGRARLAVPKQPPDETFSVAAGPYVVVVVGTKFNLGVSNRQVEVDVREGTVEVWRGGHMIRLHAGASWKGPVRLGKPGRGAQRRLTRLHAPPTEVAPLARPDDSPPDLYQEALAALARNDMTIGLGMLRQVAAGEGISAENAGYLIGRVLRDQLYQPRQAIVDWKRYRDRFPEGLLRHEADVSIIETLLTLGDKAAVRLEVEAFLVRHPHSDRYLEMKEIAARLSGPPAPAGQPPGGPSAMRAN
jgi:hypothetical protein